MLHNPNWDRRPEPSLPGLIAWLRTMPAEGTYNYMNCDGGCLVGQYMESLGIGWEAPPGVVDHTYRVTLRGIFGDNYTNDDIYSVLVHSPYTFGAALARAEAWAARHPERMHRETANART